jgi:hypothetical protein
MSVGSFSSFLLFLDKLFREVHVMSLVICWLWLLSCVAAGCCGRPEVGWCLVRGHVASCPGRCLVVCVGRGVCGVFF